MLSPACIFFFFLHLFLKGVSGASLVVQWLRPCIPSAGGLGSIPGQGANSHMLRASMKTKDPTWCTKAQHSQIKK